ncbi:MAG: carboxypeptidase regulatory-like domain-containing protein [Anaerolineales bacterium]
MPSFRKHSNISVIVLIVFLALMGLIVQGCSTAAPSLDLFKSNTPTPTPELIEIDPLSTITFQVEIPADTPSGQPILFSLLDEVTGLGLNISRKEMQQIGDTTYAITLPFPLGANIKYRYARQGDFIAEEHTTGQRPVRYRIYRVDGPGIVKDIVASWSDTVYAGPTGRIMGRITNQEDGLPVPNLLVLAGGAQTITSSTGDYLLEGLPPGLHNLVMYAFDGGFRTYQQGAVVAANSTTPANIQLTPAPLVKLIFSTTVPEGTLPAVPIRLAGNLYQLGNTFADLSGGMNTLASRMPTLNALPDGRYALEIELPAGAYLEYKYTLGDGFWNSEYTPQGGFRIRSMTVPEQDTVIQDTIDNWGEDFNSGPILFDLTTPPSTPNFDYVSIQFSPFGWTEPIPMWKLGENHWVYMLYSPLTEQEEFTYRYCRNDQCGRADDQLTPGYNAQGRSLSIPDDGQTITSTDRVEAWYWSGDDKSQEQQFELEANPRAQDFIRGVELQTYYHPSLTPRLPVAFKEIESLHANWIFLSPTWTFTYQNPPVLESVSGIDQTWSDLTTASEVAKSYGMQVAYHPQANFPVDMEEWWLSSSLDFAWWQVWFERYQNFIFSYADKAQFDGASGLVLGGDWVAPALPGGKLPDGSPSGVPLDAEQRWREIVAEVRNRFDGTLFWALPATEGEITAPPFIEDLDQVYLLWSLPLVENAEFTQDQLLETATNYLDEEVFLLDIRLEMPITIAATYPSAAGSIQGCIATNDEGDATDCYQPQLLEPPHADNPAVQNEVSAQAAAYSALLQAINEREWIDGFVSRGYYSPAELQDKSASIHGKPSQAELREWFGKLIPAQ